MSPSAAEFPFHVGIATPDVGALLASLDSGPGWRWVDLPRPAVPHDTPAGPVAPSSRVVWSSVGPFHTEVLQAEPGTVYDPRAAPTCTTSVTGPTTSPLRSPRAKPTDGPSRSRCSTSGRPSSFAYLSPPGPSSPGRSGSGEPWIELIDRANREWLEALLRGDG